MDTQTNYSTYNSAYYSTYTNSYKGVDISLAKAVGVIEALEALGVIGVIGNLGSLGSLERYLIYYKTKELDQRYGKCIERGNFNNNKSFLTP